MTPFRAKILAALVIPVTLGFLAAPSSPPPGPVLVVVLTVDQMRPDYFQRWQGEWQGGFRGLLQEGAVFLNGRQDHALTETAPGHATILSGRDPAHTGIPLNDLSVGDPSFPLLGSPEGSGASPNRFQGTTLVDWMRKADPALRFLSLSAKDRSAILTIGRSRGPVFWYRRGRFTTSRYYTDALPGWLVAWNSRRGAERLAGASWTLLRPDSAYSEKDRMPFEAEESDGVFPHLVPLDSAGAVRSVQRYPWMDSLTLDLALEGTRNLGLGKRGRPDLLALGLSATDYIGHRWGPDSREIHDHLLRLDHWLGWFFDSLSTLVPRERTVVVLTADHGVTSFPEVAQAQGRAGGRIALEAFVRGVNLSIGRLTGDSGVLRAAPGLIYGDTARLRSLRVSPESLATILAPRVWRIPGVVTAWTPATLGGASPKDVHAVRWWRALPRGFSWLVCAVAKPGYVWDNADHGTTNGDDVDVPMVFMGNTIRPGIYPDTVRTTDIAPTLAQLLGVKPEGKLDGRPIKRVLK